jgi:CRP-like cAMP-binding protein
VAGGADLAGIPLFSTLGDEERGAVAPWFEDATVSPGSKLVSEGAAGYSFYVLLEGEAVVTVDGETVATYGPGDFFGEMAILGSGRRSATVTVTAPSRVLSMFGTEFRRLQDAQPEIAAELEEAMRKRALELDELDSRSSDSA